MIALPPALRGARALEICGLSALTVFLLLLGGLLLRWVDLPSGGAGGSDVLAAITERLGVLLAGGNPYLHEYQLTRPPGQPMPYPPGALLLHVPGFAWSGLVGVQLTEVVLAGVCILLFALLGALTSWAVGTKQTALALVSLAAVYLWRQHGTDALKPYLGAAAALLLWISLPFLVMDPIAYARALFRFIGAHDDLFGWSLWVFAEQMGWPVWESGPATLLSLLVGGGTFLIALLVSQARLTTAGLAGVLAPTLLALPAVALWESWREPGRAGVEAA